MVFVKRERKIGVLPVYTKVSVKRRVAREVVLMIVNIEIRVKRWTVHMDASMANA